MNPIGADLEIPTRTWGYSRMQLDRAIEIHAYISIGMHTDACVYVCSQLWAWRGPGSSDRPMAVSTPSSQTLVSRPLSTKQNQDRLRKGERR